MIDPVSRNSPLVHPTDPRYRQAIDELHQDIGMRIDRVLLPAHWAVAEVNGHATVVINADGMRALAWIAPHPDAPAKAERLIAAMKQAHERKGRP